MRLLSAELRKLARPLTWGVAGAAALFCVLLAVGAAHNAEGIVGGPDGQMATQVAGQLSPLAAGAEAAGLMASLPGALALALLAGAHIGGEWSGRTMKNVLIQHGRRWQVLAAKLTSLWLAGAALIAICWAALAIAGPVLVHLDHLPAAHQTAAHALGLAASQAARALLVLAVFAAIGLLAAVLTRGTIGTTAAAAGAVICMLVLAVLPTLARWTPATWVQAWMGFPAGQASDTTLPTNFWSRFLSATGQPDHLAGFLGLAGVLAACALAALTVFGRSDVSG
ncbi:MAG TPA: hypothetical protein VIX86_14360 [Streptosporangiaceae bacterium]